MKILTQNPEETLAFGEQLGKWLRPGDVVLLYGDLGAGKTTLVQGLCYGLGLPKNQYIRSPTFTLINQYKGKCPIYHVDLYRLDNIQEIEALGLEDIFFGDGVTLVEWAEKLEIEETRSSFPPFGLHTRIEIRIQFRNESVREFHISQIGKKHRPLPVFTLH